MAHLNVNAEQQSLASSQLSDGNLRAETDRSLLDVVTQTARLNFDSLMQIGRDLELLSPLAPMTFRETGPTPGIEGGGSGYDYTPSTSGSPASYMPNYIVSLLRLNCEDGNTLLFVKKQPIQSQTGEIGPLATSESRLVTVVAANDPSYFAVIVDSRSADQLVKELTRWDTDRHERLRKATIDSRQTQHPEDWAQLSEGLHRQYVAPLASARRAEAIQILSELELARNTYPHGWLDEGNVSIGEKKKVGDRYTHTVRITWTMPEPLANYPLQLDLTRTSQELLGVVITESYQMDVRIKSITEGATPEMVERAFRQVFANSTGDTQVAKQLYDAAAALNDQEAQ